MVKLAENKEQKLATATRVSVDVRADTPSYYVNYINVSHTPYDFTLSLTKIPSPLATEQVEAARSGKPIVVEAIIQIVMPPLLIDGLIRALIDQKEKFAVTLAQQEKNNEPKQ